MKEQDCQRDTRQRRMVYEAVMNRCDHPDADRIYWAVHQQDPRVSKATVYRNLRLLSEKGLIRQIKLSGADRFDRTLPSHDHILCTRCGAVCDAPTQYQPTQDEAVQAASGYLIFGHSTVFEGLCPACRAEG